MESTTPVQLRSAAWFAPDDLHGFASRARALQMGYTRADFTDKPVIGILSTWSDLNPCHAHFKDRAEAIKRGVWQAGGFPVVIPVQSVSETYVRPSSMMYRNFLAMEAEEVLRSYPIDGAVLMGGCDKTTPGLLMGAISVDLPTIFMPAGPMLRGNWRGEKLGSGIDIFKHWADRRAGNLDDCSWGELEEGIARSYGHCMVMGTASTMTSVAEALGLALPGSASIPAADANHPRMAENSGRRIVEMVREGLKISDILDERSFENAIRIVHALSGSTNAVIHLIALARRAGVPLTLDSFDEIAHATPVLANIKPAGDTYLMEDFFYAGGLRALMVQLGSLLRLDSRTVTGRSLGDNIVGASTYDSDVIRDLDHPISEAGGIAVLRGNLAPDGAIIKPTAAEARLLKHTGRAVVFEGYDDMRQRIDDEDLDVDETSVLVLRNAGPLGGPGMPEWGQLPIPVKLLRQGVRDMVRVSDARMSGTSYGACVLHVAPEAYVGGPLALVKDGDLITLDVGQRRLALHVDEAEMARRWAEWRPPAPRFTRGYGSLFVQHVSQANDGCDFDFLAP